MKHVQIMQEWLLFGLLLAFLALSTTVLPYEGEGDGVVSILLINTVKKLLIIIQYIHVEFELVSRPFIFPFTSFVLRFNTLCSRNQPLPQPYMFLILEYDQAKSS